MARATRIALDLALVSITKAQPVISKIWGSAKTALAQSRLRALVCNPVMNTIESKLSIVFPAMVSKLQQIRDAQLQATSRAVKPVVGTAWQYSKTEVAPPLTQGIFHGPVGRNFENAAAKFADSFITGIQQKIQDIDAEQLRKIKEKEDAIKAELAKAKAEAEAKKKQEMENKKKEAEKMANESKKVQEKPKEEKKAQANPQEKKDEPARRKPPKSNRREEKKGSPKKK